MSETNYWKILGSLVLCVFTGLGVSGMYKRHQTAQDAESESLARSAERQKAEEAKGICKSMQGPWESWDFKQLSYSIRRAGQYGKGPELIQRLEIACPEELATLTALIEVVDPPAGLRF